MATPVAKKTAKVSEDDVRAVVGALFLVLTLSYVWQALKDVRSARI